jgi:hypothetical protein
MNRYVKEILRDEIRDLINRTITPNTGYSIEFETLQQAVDASVESIYEKVNNFEVLTQEMIDEQADDDGYLEGAQAGDLVFFDDPMLVSEATISEWYGQSTADIRKQSLDISDTENIVFYALILNRLWLYNQNNMPADPVN